MADDAVWCEPVSAAKFPDNREKYRENRKFGPQMTMAITSKRSNHAGFKRNSFIEINRERFWRNRETVSK